MQPSIPLFIMGSEKVEGSRRVRWYESFVN